SPARAPTSARGIDRAPWAWLASYASLLRTSTSTASPLASAWRASSTEIRRAVSWVGGVIVGFSTGLAVSAAAAAGDAAPPAATATSTPPASARPLRNIRCIHGPPGRQPLAGRPGQDLILPYPGKRHRQGLQRAHSECGPPLGRIARQTEIPQTAQERGEGDL